MKSHASMNRIYRLVWNAALSLWVAVAENAKGRSKGGSSRSSVDCSSVHQGDGAYSGGGGGSSGRSGFTLNTACRAALALIVSSTLISTQVHAANAADAAVVAGAGNVATAGLTTTITQTSQNLAIDWTSLSTAANEALRFNQPNSSAIALNRITGTSPSELLGSLTANGQVFILNPNGVLFGAGSQVNVGGLVASTLNMSNADFMAGKHSFSGTGTGAVINQGTMTAAPSGYLALLAPEVRNEGVMTASLGTALLAAGNKVTLNLDNGSLLGYSIDQGAVNALAENKQLIKADGGQVLLGAKALDSLTSATVNNTGIIEAKTLQNKAGRILLMGDMEYGTVNIGGTLDASAPNGGDGGFIETSAANFTLAPDFRIKAQAPQGKAGKWLLDPASITIAGGSGGAANTIYEDSIEAAGANIVISATDSIVASGTFSDGDLVADSGLNITLQTTATGGGTGIDLTGSAHGAGLTIKTSGGGTVSMSTGNTGQTLKTSAISVTGGGTINLNSGGPLDISNTTLQTDGGAITLTGAGTSLDDGVKISNATLNAGSGALTITGSSNTGTGVLLGAGAIVSNTGHVSITGTSGGAAATGVNIAGAAQVSSSGGNVTVNGTFNNPSAADGTGVRIAGKVAAQTGTVAITGDATVGSGGGYGVLIDTGADISAASGVAVTGTYQAPTTAAGAGIQMQAGTIASAGTIALTGNLSATSATGAYGLNLTGGNISATGAGTMNLTGSGVPALAPAGAYDLNLAGTTLTSGGGQIKLSGDRVNIGSSVNAGTGRVLVTPTTITRRITLAGADETIALNLSNAELNRITAGTLAIGGSAFRAGIAIGDTGGAVNMVSTSSLSLINESNDGLGTITQSAGLTVANLNVDGADINLSNTSNQISQISGRTAIANINVRSALALTVGTVDGTAGISGYGHVTLISGGVLTATAAGITNLNGQLTASSVGGMRLDNAGNRFAFFGALQNSGSGDIILRNSTATTFSGGISNGGGRIDIGNTGNVTLNSTISSSNATDVGGTAATAAVSVLSTGRISAGVGGGVTHSNGGSVYLQAGNGYIGSDSANRVAVSTSGAVTAVAAGGTSQVNLDLSGGATVENISAVGAVRVSAAAGDLAVKTVSGSAVTLSAAAGAILDANGAANNITATTLNATAANGITLGTDVTGLQTLTTTGAAGDISITAANALNTSNLNISTNAGAAQTVSLSSAAGITVGSAFGNAQDNFKLIATGGNINVNAALQANKLSLSTTGTTAQTAAISATGLELLGTGSHTLNNAGNAVTTLAGNTGNLDYVQAGALTIGTVNTAGLTTTGKLLVRTTGAASDLTVANAVSAGSTASDALVLASGRNFLNSSGSATPLTTGSGGRYLVYSTDPTANTFGSMTSTGNAFNRSYAANGPADASMTSIAGNRFVYSVQPTLNISGDNKTKFVGGVDPALTYSVNSGLVAGDTAASALGGALLAPTGAATTGPTHVITQGSLASSLGYAINYTPGTLTVTGAPAPAPAADASLTPTAAAISSTSPALVAAYNNTIETVSNLASAIPRGSGGGQDAASGSGNSGNEGSGGVSAALDPGGATLNATADARESDGDSNN